MNTKINQTASFMIRFNQRIYEENGESKIQWRGKVSHVQNGDELRFVDFKDAVSFIQKKIEHLTIEATKDHHPEQIEGLLKKSFQMWKTAAKTGTEILKETIKDPKKQIGQIQDQISFLGDEISEKVQETVQIDQWRSASRSDFNDVKESINALSKEIKKLNTKINSLSKKK